jgi:hypothetical protein
MTDLFVPICIVATVYFLENSTSKDLKEKSFRCDSYVGAQIKQFYGEDENSENKNSFQLNYDYIIFKNNRFSSLINLEGHNL